MKTEQVVVPELVEPKVADPILLSGLIQGPVGDFQPVSVQGPGAGPLGDFDGPGGAGNIPLSPDIVPEPAYQEPEPELREPVSAGLNTHPGLSSYDSSGSRFRWSRFANLDGRNLRKYV